MNEPPDAEDRILHAVFGMIESRVISGLPARKQGPGAHVMIRRLVHESQTVQIALRKIVEDVMEKLRRSLPDAEPESVEGRWTVLDNETSCYNDHCNRTTRAAVVEIQDGVVVGVECEVCAPEFKEDGSG